MMLVLTRSRSQVIEYDLGALIDVAVGAADQLATPREMRSRLIDALNGMTTIKVTVVEVRDNKVRLGSEAAKIIRIHRPEGQAELLT